jgi:hypothetical protein
MPPQSWNNAERAEIFRWIVEHASEDGIPIDEVYSHVTATYGCTDRTVRNVLGQLSDLVETRRDPHDRRRRRAYVTRKGMAYHDQQFVHAGRFPGIPRALRPIDPDSPGTRPRYLQDRPTRRNVKAEGGDLSSCSSLEPEPFRYPDRRYLRHAAWQSDIQEIERTLRDDWIEEVPRLRLFGRRREFFLQFTGTDDQYFQEYFYDQFYVGDAEYDATTGVQLKLYRSFVISRGQGDPIAERTWQRGDGARQRLGPEQYIFAPAIELDGDLRPTRRPVVLRSGRETTIFNHGVVAMPIESAYGKRPSFWAELGTAWDDAGGLTDHVFRLRRTGRADLPWFTVERYSKATKVRLPKSANFDLQALLNHLADPDRLHRFVSRLPKDHVPLL